MNSGLSVESQSKGDALQKLQQQLAKVARHAAYVGIPATSAADRAKTLLSMAEKITSATDARGKKASKRQAKKYAKLASAAAQDVNNAELLHIFSKGSPLRNQPARPVLEPAVESKRQPISRELTEAARAQLQGDEAGAKDHMKRAAMIAQNAARARFTDSSNGWASNAPSTIAAKGSDRPGIDTGSMRNAIVGFVAEDE